jgi:hypothetical protein
MNFQNQAGTKLVLSILLPPALALCASVATAAPVSPSPTPSAAPSATPTPYPSVTPKPDAPPNYTGGQQSQYIATANAAFVTQRDAKFQAFMDTRNAFETAGGINPKGFTSPEAVAERRDLLSKVRAANDDYLAFVTNQESVYRAELEKTPLVQSDIDSVAQTFLEKANVPRAIKLQQMEQDLLTCSDDMLGDLQKWKGQWSLKNDKLAFKKKTILSTYAALEQKYNALADGIEQLHNPTPGASPSPSPGVSPSPTALPRGTP